MLNQTLLDTLTFKKKLEELVTVAENEIIICSPFIKLKALRWISSKIRNGVEVKIITRLTVSDVLQKVSDFEICQFSLDKGWKIGLITNLHAKMYIIDQYKVLVGSNNFTPKGLGLGTDGNEELSVLFEPTTETSQTIKNIYPKVHWLDQKKINLMDNYLYKNCKKNLIPHCYRIWPDDIYQTTNKSFALFLSSFPDTTPQAFLKGRKSIFLKNIFGCNNVKRNFLNCDAYLWLISTLENRFDQNNNFGFITSQIHKKILDNPLPYRSSIKEITNYLFQWVDKFSDDVEIITHPHSKSMKLLSLGNNIST